MDPVHAQEELEIRTKGRGLVSIQKEVAAIVRNAGVAVGQAHLFLLHTSAGLLITENADPDVHRDLESWLRTQAPEGTDRYLHDAEGPDDMPAHLRTALTQTQLSVPVAAGRMVLGTWQGIYLFEHRRDPPRREIALHLIGE